MVLMIHIVMNELLIPRKVFCTALVLLSLVAAGLASAQQQTQERDEYKIGPDDVLNISVWKNEALSRTIPVRPDGKISLPLLNDVQAAGLTAEQLREVLTEKLSEYESAPEVSVTVIEVRGFKVSVLGEVQRPGRFELRSSTTVLDAIALAGGFKDFAATNRIVILRPEGKGTKRIPFNYKKATAAGGETENFFLEPGDIILVP
jgi:polysaccharide biosynthesis/export protein